VIGESFAQRVAIVLSSKMGQNSYYQAAPTQLQPKVFEKIGVELSTVFHIVCNTYYV
jgi:hypothetical protein